MRYAVANNARTKLTAPLSIIDNVMYVQSTESFLESEYPYLVTIDDEILEVKPATMTAFEILERGCEGTTPADHPAGSVVENRFTAGTYQALVDNIMDASRSALWAEITGKPSTFTPSPHNHAWSEVTNKPSTFTPSAHTHTSEQITDFWDFWIGVPIPWYKETPPPGFIELNGAAISRTTYSKLFARYGTRFGAGNGSTTFNLPDLRGEFIRGWDHGRGVDAGRLLGTSQLDQMQRITGSTRIIRGGTPNAEGALSEEVLDYSGVYSAGNGGNYIFQKFDSALSPNARTSSSTDGETRPRNVAFMYITKY